MVGRRSGRWALVLALAVLAGGVEMVEAHDVGPPTVVEFAADADTPMLDLITNDVHFDNAAVVTAEEVAGADALGTIAVLASSTWRGWFGNTDAAHAARMGDPYSDIEPERRTDTASHAFLSTRGFRLVVL